MNKFAFSTAAAIVMSLGAIHASAQSYQSQTTTVQSSPDGQTSTTTTESRDAYGSYRKTVTATHRYDDGAFAAPAGYTYSRYAVGDHVPAVLLNANNLTLSEYADFQLDAPPRGLEWIRVGDDALLVDRTTGEVIQTDYNLFE